MKIRLMFEPHDDVKCNVDRMFQCYGENYLSEFKKFEWAGYSIMNASDTKYQRGEPLYSFQADDADEIYLNFIFSYVKNNPMHGYHTHIQVHRPNENPRMVA